ncbi:MAG TPA: hypothetical protein VLA43_20800, partial [Longimicrobiales bacterium]|nr:hypothetical protein [Longimicrobiales bacterium]
SGPVRGWTPAGGLHGGPSAAAEAHILAPLRREWRGTAVWVEPPPVGSTRGAVRITVVHLAN